MPNDLTFGHRWLTTFHVVWNRYLRGLKYLFDWLILEKPRGLDFSMRMKSIEASGNHGYALTSRKAFRNILRDLPVSTEDSFLDVGCGKGGVLRHASELSFGRIDGIELDLRLHQIAKKNIEILRIGHRVGVIHANAVSFDGYARYNFFFLFNPFDPDIYDLVITNIIQSINRVAPMRTTWLLCYGASSDVAIRNSNLFVLYRDELCPHRRNPIRIWKSR